MTDNRAIDEDDDGGDDDDDEEGCSFITAALESTIQLTDV